MISKNDRRYTIWPVCPYCGNTDRNAWKLTSLDIDEADTLINCESCKSEYRIIVHITRVYSTKTLTE